MTGAEAPGETEIEQGSNNHEPSEDVQSCGGVCAVGGFFSSTGGQESVPTKTTADARAIEVTRECVIRN